MAGYMEISERVINNQDGMAMVNTEDHVNGSWITNLKAV